MPTDCLKLLHANFCNVKTKKKKNLGGYAVSAPICQTFKTNKIMKTFKLTKEEQSILIAALLEYENKMRLLKIRSEEKKAMMLRYKLLKK